MKLLVLTHNYPRFRGDFSGTFIEALSETLQERGHDVTVLAPYDQRFDRAASDHTVRLRTYRYAWPDRLHVMGYMRSTQRDRSLRLSSLLLAPGLFFCGALAALRTARSERPDIIHAHWLLPNGFIAAVASRLLHIPLVVSVPGSDVMVSEANRLFGRMARFTLGEAAAITTNSDDLRGGLLALGAPAHKISLIIYGVDPLAFTPDAGRRAALRARLGIAESVPVVLAVGRLVPKKGFDVLVRAAAAIAAPAHIVIVGDGDQRRELEEMARAGGAGERVHFVGNVPRHELAGYYNVADLLAMPSVRLPVDGLNVSVVEAMACGLPIVASSVGGNPLVVAHGDNGLLVAEGDSAQLAGAINILLNDPAARQRMGRRSRERALQEFSWASLAAAYEQIYRRITSTGKA